MKLKDIKAIPWRIRFLLTRRWELVPGVISKESWRTAWAIVGIHSHNWWWVRRYGGMPCGCTRNPLTRRRVLTLDRCPQHSPTRHWRWEERYGRWEEQRGSDDGAIE